MDMFKHIEKFMSDSTRGSSRKGKKRRIQINPASGDSNNSGCNLLLCTDNSQWGVTEHIEFHVPLIDSKDHTILTYALINHAALLQSSKTQWESISNQLSQNTATIDNAIKERNARENRIIHMFLAVVKSLQLEVNRLGKDLRREKNSVKRVNREFEEYKRAEHNRAEQSSSDRRKPKTRKRRRIKDNINDDDNIHDDESSDENHKCNEKMKVNESATSSMKVESEKAVPSTEENLKDFEKLDMKSQNSIIENSVPREKEEDDNGEASRTTVLLKEIDKQVAEAQHEREMALLQKAAEQKKARHDNKVTSSSMADTNKVQNTNTGQNSSRKVGTGSSSLSNNLKAPVKNTNGLFSLDADDDSEDEFAYLRDD
eukprot:g549.t1